MYSTFAAPISPPRRRSTGSVPSTSSAATDISESSKAAMTTARILVQGGASRGSEVDGSSSACATPNSEPVIESKGLRARMGSALTIRRSEIGELRRDSVEAQSRSQRERHRRDGRQALRTEERGDPDERSARHPHASFESLRAHRFVPWRTLSERRAIENASRRWEVFRRRRNRGDNLSVTTLRRVHYSPNCQQARARAALLPRAAPRRAF